MTIQIYRPKWKLRLMAFSILCLFVAPSFAASVKEKKQQARSQFEIAARMREELNGLPQRERSRREYQRVTDAYRRVYYVSPTSSKADASVVAVAELLAESGRAFNDEKALRTAIAQYEFLRREYPGSKYRFGALFTVGQIYKEDLEQNDKARETFQEVIRRYPHLQLAADAREALAEMDQQARSKQKSRIQEIRRQDARTQDLSSESPRSNLPLVAGIRHWSTPDYTRVAIDLEQEVKYEVGRVPNPDRIFFDLHDAKLASTLVGKTFEVSDGFLRRVRVAQFQKGMVRVVLEVDAVSDYSAFLLPNPYRLVVDIHGRKANVSTPQQAQSEEEKGTSPSVAPQESQQESKILPVATAPLPTSSSTPEAAHETSSASVMDSAASSDVKFGPRMADGSFFSRPTSPTPIEASFSSPVASASSRDAATRHAPVRPESKAPDETPALSQTSTKSEVTNLKGLELKATDKPTSEPTVHVVAPRVPVSKTATSPKPKQRYPEIHQAQPTANGQRSLIRALGLKVGRIVIDAGHGGHDTGTIGSSGMQEKDLVLDVALRLGRLLKSRMGADVIYTRDDDTFIPLETRTAIANQQRADLFISIHANSSQDPTARGVETYYLNFNPSPDALSVAARENAVSEKSVHELGDLVKKITLKDKVEESREFAMDVQRSLYLGLSGKDKTLRDRGVKKAPFIVLIGANMPSILAEISFVSNPGDERKLRTPEYRQKVAEALYRGVARYVNGLSGVKVASKMPGAEGAQ